ncbi:MAG: T9SS type A sorting domain-containing protein [Bacteroidetes bacterium]|nr:T9SS type A sorting domain-containing protein [Bacteroidota bacterium]
MKKLITQVSVLLTIGCAFTFNAKAQHSDTLYPAADAYAVTFGGGQGKNSFMKFDISSLPANSVVGNVTLQVNVTQVGISWDGDVKFMNVNNQAWTESDLQATLMGFTRTDTVLQLLGFGMAPGLASSADIKQILLKDYNLSNNFCTVMLKDFDDPTCCTGGGNAVNSPDSLMTGNIFNDYIVYTPRETPASKPRLVVTYTVAPTITTQPVNATACVGTSATFSVTASGDAPLSYQWQKNGVDIGGATSDIYSIGSVVVTDAGNYRCYVTNAVGSDTSNAASLTVNTNPVVTLSGNPDICTGGSTILTGSSGGTRQWYKNGQIIVGEVNTTYTATTAGIYNMIKTNVTGCSDSASTGITVIVHPLPVVNLGADVTQCGGTVILNAGNPGSTYAWTPAATTQTISVSSIGNYSVIVTDANGCTGSDAATVTINPLPSITLDSTFDVNCNGGADGEIYTTSSGGTAPYTYLWMPGAGLTGDYIGVSAGAYTLTTTDANGCTKTKNATVNEPTAISVTVDSVFDATSCNSSNGKIYTTLSGGTSAFTYVWAPSGGTTGDATGLAIGTYTLNVIDANGCASSATSAIINAGLITLAFDSSFNVTCNGGSDGEIYTTATGGAGALTYNWNPGNGNADDTTGIPAGTYTLLVTDASGCTQSVTASLTQPAVLSSSVTGTFPSCAGDNNATANLTVNGGSGNFSYLWSNGATTQDLTGIVAGQYIVTVVDLSCADTVKDTILIIDPDPLAAFGSITNVSCNGGSNGSVNLTAIGGSTQYVYLWSPGGATTQDVSGLTSGTYTVQVIDTVCIDTVIKFFTITQPTALAATFSINAPICGNSNGTAQVNPTGGTPPLTYLWNTGSTQSFVFGLTGLPTNTLIVTITDSKGCTFTDTTYVSCISAVNEAFLEITDVAVYPNPSNGDFSITLNAPAKGNYVIEINNELGQKVYAYELKNFSGNFTKKFSAADFSSGIYMLSIKNENNRIIRKVMVQ